MSVDIDGNDYWVTKALLKHYKPAVISVEFNSNFPATMATTIPNCLPEFTWGPGMIKYYGVSLRAVYDLGLREGYSYVFHMLYTDIFLVRSDLLPEEYRGMSILDTFDVYPLHMIPISQMKY